MSEDGLGPAELFAVVQAGIGACYRRSSADAPPGGKGPSTLADGSAHSGLPGSLKLRELNADQRRTICDWTAQQYGGYGKTTPCGLGSHIFE